MKHDPDNKKYFPSVNLHENKFSINNRNKFKRLYDSSNNMTIDVTDHQYNILKDCKNGLTKNDLLKRYSNESIKQVIYKKYLTCEENLYKNNSLNSFEIETSTICNWKCKFCPSAKNKRKPEFMDMNLYKEIIKKISDVKNISYVSLHFYNEPLIDKYFKQRVRELQTYGIPLLLATNAQYLTEGIIDFLKNNHIYKIIINFPSMDENEFLYLTGCNEYKSIVKNIKSAVKSGFNVELAIYSNKYNKNNYLELFGLSANNIIDFEFVDRAGSVTHENLKKVYLKPDELCGCFLLYQRMYINIKGDCVLCCQDYHQQYKYASILDGPLEEIYSNQLEYYRKLTWKKEHCNNDFICLRCEIMKKRYAEMRFYEGI